MRRLVRWFRVALLAGLGCACLGLGALWVRSHYRADYISYVAADGSWRIFVETNVDQLALALTQEHPEFGQSWLEAGWHGMSDSPISAGDWRRQLANYPGARASRGFASFEWFA